MYDPIKLFRETFTPENSSNVREIFCHVVIGQWLRQEAASREFHDLLGIGFSGEFTTILNPAGARKRFGSNADKVIFATDAICNLEVKLPGCEYEDSQKIFLAPQMVSNYVKGKLNGMNLLLGPGDIPVRWVFAHIGDKLRNPKLDVAYKLKRGEKEDKYTDVVFTHHQLLNETDSVHTFRISDYRGSTNQNPQIREEWEALIATQREFTIYKRHIPWPLVIERMRPYYNFNLSDFFNELMATQ